MAAEAFLNVSFKYLYMSCSLSSERLVKQKKKGGLKNAMKRVEREETETEKEVRIEEEER